MLFPLTLDRLSSLNCYLCKDMEKRLELEKRGKHPSELCPIRGIERGFGERRNKTQLAPLDDRQRLLYEIGSYQYRDEEIERNYYLSYNSDNSVKEKSKDISDNELSSIKGCGRGQGIRKKRLVDSHEIGFYRRRNEEIMCNSNLSYKYNDENFTKYDKDNNFQKYEVEPYNSVKIVKHDDNNSPMKIYPRKPVKNNVLVSKLFEKLKIERTEHESFAKEGVEEERNLSIVSSTSKSGPSANINQPARAMLKRNQKCKQKTPRKLSKKPPKVEEDVVLVNGRLLYRDSIPFKFKNSDFPKLK